MKHRNIAAFTAALIALTGTFAMPCSELTNINTTTQATAAESAETGKCGENAVYTISDGVLTISGTGSTGDFERVLPYDGENIPIVPPIDPDSYSPFYDRDDIREIVINDGITKIGQCTFDMMKNVEKITLPHTLKEIGSRAFSGIAGLRSIDIPASTEIIAPDAFTSCPDMERMNIYSKVLDNCYFLSNIFDVKFIGTFRDTNVETYIQCYSETNNKMLIYLDDATETESGMCGEHAMYSISDGVLTISGTGRISDYCSPEGNVNDGFSRFADRTDINVIIINEGITGIGKNAFCGMKNIESIQLPESLINIDSGAFFRTFGYSTLDIPKNVESIAPDAFGECSELKRINIFNPSFNDTEFFRLMPYLAKIIGVIERSATEKNILAMIQPEDITIDYIHAENAPVQSGKCGENAAYTINMNGILTIRGTGALYDYPAYSTGDGKHDNSPFSGRYDIRGIIIDDGITSVGSNMFSCSSWMYFVTLPDSLESIGEGAFSGVTGFTDIEIPASVKEIGKNAFTDCFDLKTVRFNSGAFIRDSGIDFLPAGLETVITAKDSEEEKYLKNDPATKDLRFSYLEDGENVIIEEGSCGADLKYTLSESGTLTISGSGSMSNFSYDGDTNKEQALPVSPFKGSKKIKRVVFKENVTGIGTYAFADCTELENVTFSKTLGSIAPNPFVNCTKLKSLTIPDSVVSISDQAFKGMDGLEELNINALHFDSVKFMDSVPESVRLRVYGNSDLCYYLNKDGRKYDNISASDALGGNISFVLTSEGDLTIKGTGSMFDFPVAHEYTTREGEDKVWYTESPFKELSQYFDIKTITVEEGVASIGSGLFTGITAPENITLPESVKSIAEDVFRDMKSAGTVTVLSRHLDSCTALKALPESTKLIVPEGADYIADLGRENVQFADAAALLPGDANADGKVTLADALAILQYVANADKYPLSDSGLRNADVFMRGDGITGMDAVAVQQYDTGVVDALPVSVS